MLRRKTAAFGEEWENILNPRDVKVQLDMLAPVFTSAMSLNSD